MAENNDATKLLGRDASHELDNVTEPDDAFLIASEQEQSVQAPRRALVVIVTDHPDDSAQDTSRLAGELLTEADFTVDGAVIVKSKKSKIRQAIETGVVEVLRGPADLLARFASTFHLDA